jgi:predicted metal-dependent enzyme (double-stranded beta helix superfamily)/catechol 2,3-dioxygenase-like lactoylglutathione lyase family enzyme
MRLHNDPMDLLDQLLNDTRDAMSAGQAVVADLLQTALADHERFAAVIQTRAKPWFFAADETMTVFCTEGRPGNASSPHDHGTWSVLGCFEGSEESWWHETDENGNLQNIGSGVLRSGQAHSLPADAIHAVMNRWDSPNGIIHIYQGNFLASERHIWDPVTSERHPAGLTEPLAPSLNKRASTTTEDEPSGKPALAGTAFAAVTVSDLNAATQWMADAFGLRALTDQDDSCAVHQPYNYLIEPASLTIVGLHGSSEPKSTGKPDRGLDVGSEPKPTAGLEHIAFRVLTISQLEQWHHDLKDRGLKPSPLTAWDFGTFVDVTGPEQLTVRLFVPAVR